MSEIITRNILPIIWGHNVWSSIDNYIAVLPDELYKKEIECIMSFFNSLTLLIPCNSCKLSYMEYSKEPDTNIYDVNNFKTREGVIKLLWKLRDKVNKKLQVEYFITLNYYTLKLNYSICDTDNKNLDGIISHIIDAPFIQEKIMEKVLTYLKKNSEYDIEKTIKLIKTLKTFIKDIKSNDFNLNNDKFKLLIKRNSKCHKYKEKINKYKIINDFNYEQSFEHDKESYIKLFSLGCNYLKIEETIHLIEK
jgi:hypothetical protein